MRQLSIFFATLVLTCFAFFPLSVFADDLDDLDITMEVIDDMNRTDGVFSEMRGPKGGDDDDDHLCYHDCDGNNFVPFSSASCANLIHTLRACETTAVQTAVPFRQQLRNQNEYCLTEW